MAPDVNWDVIESIAKGKVENENVDSMEEGISVLKSVDELELQDDPEKLILLIQTAKKALDYREVTLNDLLQDQEDEVEDLKRQLVEERKLGSGAIPRDADFYRTENKRLLDEKEVYEQRNQELNDELVKITEERNKLDNKAEDSRKLVRDLKNDIGDLRQNLRDYQGIIDKQYTQRLSVGGDSEMQERLHQRNKHISDLLTQITELEKVNRDLEDGAQKLRKEMEGGREDMEKMVEEYEKMRKIIGSSDKFSEDLGKQNAQLKMQVADLREELVARREDDDNITTAVNEKVEEWSARIKEKDDEIQALRRTVATLKTKISTSGLDRDRLNVERLSKKLEDSKMEVDQLKTALAQSVGEMEEQTAIVEDLRREHGTNREVLAYKAQIKRLQEEVNDHQSSAKEAESRRAAAESEAQDNDFKLTEALRRVSMLESGQYGLTEAVNEIKDCKSVIRDRDREIRELTQATNLLEEKLNDFIEENEEFRERLGIDPRNLDDIILLRKNRALRQQQFRAENQILLKEIEDLEEERISLKKQIRHQAQSQIQKAADQGLQEGDIELLEDFVDELIRMRRESNQSDQARQSRSSQQAPGSSVLEKLLAEEKLENQILHREKVELGALNEQLQVALKEINDKLNNDDFESGKVIRIPSLERFVDMLEKKRAEKYGDASGSELDDLRGRNDELRNELKRSREEQVLLSSKNALLSKQVEGYQVGAIGNQNKLWSANLPLLSLPRNVDPQSSDVITALHEQLLELLSDDESKSEKVKQLNDALDGCRRQLQVLRHQTHILYKEHHSSIEEREQERKSWDAEKDALQEMIDKSAVRVDEYERLLSALESNPDETKRRLAETSRKISLLRVNEKTLIRRHKALEASEEMLGVEQTRLRRELGMMEKAVAEKISYMERHKLMTSFKLESLQKIVENSVPESELAALNRRYDDLTIKYRDLLQKENQEIASAVKMDTLKEELKISLEGADAIRSELAIEKEKRLSMEQILKKSNISLTMDDSDSLLKRVTNGNDVDSSKLLAAVLSRAQRGFNKWKRQSRAYRIASMTLTLIVLALQVVQVIILQLPQIKEENKLVMGTVLPAITSGIVALLMKLKWAEKGTKYKRAAQFYGQLTKQLEYRLHIREAGGLTNDMDSIELCNAAMIAEEGTVTVLEMKELNERQKADHASRMYQRIQGAMDDLQGRNAELESKFTQLTKLNLTAQQTERELRDELADAVPKKVNDAEKKKIGMLEEELAKAKVKIAKLQDISDISVDQLKVVQSQQQTRDREIRSLRKQVREFQVQSDDNALIGQLHQQILNIQASEQDSLKKLEKTEKKVSKLEAHVLRMEKQLDEKDDKIYLLRIQSNNKVKQQRKTIQSLRQQFSGALPLAQQEKFSLAMKRLQGDRSVIREELRRARLERENLEDRLGEAEIQKASLEELRRAIEDNRGADKLTEWSSRMDKLRLQDMKLQRQVTRQSEEIKYLENLNIEHEATIENLEEDIVRLLKAQEDHQVEWEMREMDLERLLDEFHHRQRDVTKKAKRLEDITLSLPDPSLPTDVQLTQALQMIIDQNKTIVDMQGFTKALQLENERLKDVRHNLEGDVTSRDRVINELRLHMPTTSSVSQTGAHSDAGSQQQLRVAMETVDTLKKRLQAKDEALARHKQLLEEARKEQEATKSNHDRELVAMQQKLHQRTQDMFARFKTSSKGAPPRKDSRLDTAHAKELEEMVREQDATIAALMDRVRAANADVTKQKQSLASVRTRCEMERNKLLEENETNLNSIRLKLAKKQQMVEGLQNELELTKQDLEKQKEANTRAPMTTMKNLVERLKQKLHEKEIQQKKLSHALTELRTDLVEQAKENVRAKSAMEMDTNNVEQLVERRTSHYKDDIEELKDKVAALQRGAKQAKKVEESLQEELKKVLVECEKKEQAMKRMKMDLRTKDTDASQLRDKLKRMIKSRGGAQRFGDEKPVKLDRNHDMRLVEEDPIAPVDASAEQGSRPSSSHHLSAPDEVNQLKEEIALLKTESEQLKGSSKKSIELAKWEAKKQWQGKVEQLKVKLQEKEKIVEGLQKQTGNLRDTISRLERDKIRRSALPIGPPIHAQGTGEDSVAPKDHVARQYLHKIEELNRQLHDLGEENKDLRQSAVLPSKKIFAEMEEKNRILSDRLEQLQRDVLTSSRDGNIAEGVRLRESELEGRILRLSSENAQLLFEIEQMKLDLPRLQERVDYQQKYIDLLQSEKKESQTRVQRIKSLPDKQVPQGRSGKSVVELEKTVVLMKKVVERVQRENEQLKKAPGVVSNQQLNELRDENQNIKKQLHEMTQRIGGQLSKRYEAKSDSIERLVAENQRLKKDLTKHISTKDKLRSAKDMALAENHNLVKEVEDLKRKLSVAESKAPMLQGTGSKGYNSVVNAKMLEAKLKKTEESLEQQKLQADALKAILEEKTEEERNLRRQIKDLQEQVEILERFPPNAGSSDPATVRELQLARLEIARLENEKEELQHRVRKEKPTSAWEEEEEDVASRAEILRLETQLKVVEEEKMKMQGEIARMREELSHFDSNFFDEIEDLKYNYAESMKRNVTYEDQLRAFSRQFGVSVDIPNSDSDS